MLFFLALPLAFSDEIPDYDSPYAPIFTDKSVYSWTDKIQMKIFAPSWNTDRHLIDSIGGSDEHSIKISTREHSLEPYRFTETETNSGIFTAEVILTGFLHDVDGDGDFDTVPRTTGSGPTGGFLEVDRESAVTISFEFADGVFVTKSVPVSWNVGTIAFSEDRYIIDDSAQLSVVDFDLNLNPETLDQIRVVVSSDSDVAGVAIDAIETGKNSGVFVASIHFTQYQPTSGNRLYTLPGDMIYAQYDDHTLPEPFSKSDSLDVKTTAMLESHMTTNRIINSEIFFADSSGDPLTAFSTTGKIQVVGSLANEQTFPQPFVYLLQIKDESGYVVFLSWVRGEIGAHQSIDVSQSWLPMYSGGYSIDTFVWGSMNGMTPLSLPQSTSIFVG